MRKAEVFNNTNEFLDWTEKFDKCFEKKRRKPFLIAQINT